MSRDSVEQRAARHCRIIDDQLWGQFQQLLDQPARDLPKLRALLAEPSPFADDEVRNIDQALRPPR